MSLVRRRLFVPGDTAATGRYSTQTSEGKQAPIMSDLGVRRKDDGPAILSHRFRPLLLCGNFTAHFKNERRRQAAVAT
jgi:hypothetical protein